MNSLFEQDLIFGMDFILEWAHSGHEFDFGECFESQIIVEELGFVPFLQWPNMVNQRLYLSHICAEWSSLVEAIRTHPCVQEM